MIEQENIWQQAVDLTNRMAQVTSGIGLLCDNNWTSVVAVFLTQANERLDSIRILLDKNYCESAEILTRSLFELTVNLAYIAKNASERLPKYLNHGGLPLTNEDTQQLRRKLEQEQPPDVKDIVPGQPWKNLKYMCCDLGWQWLKEYETFYRYVSVPTHAGSFTFGTNYLKLLKKQEPLSNRDKATVLVTALEFHLRVANVAANVFPKQINPEVVNEIQTECGKLGQSLVKRDA